MVADPPGVTASELPTLLKGIGADSGRVGPVFAGVQAFERKLQAEGVSDPSAGASLNLCTSTQSPLYRSLAGCMYYALLDHNEIVVASHPYFLCGGPRRCRLTNETEIVVSIPGAPSTGTSS